MNVTYSEGVRQWGEGFPLAQEGTKRLEEILGPVGDQATAEWDRAEDEKGRAIFVLRVHDSVGDLTVPLTLDELRSPDQVSFRMNRLSIDINQVKLKRKLDELIGKGGNGEDRRRA